MSVFENCYTLLSEHINVVKWKIQFNISLRGKLTINAGAQSLWQLYWSIKILQEVAKQDGGGLEVKAFQFTTITQRLVLISDEMEKMNHTETVSKEA